MVEYASPSDSGVEVYMAVYVEMGSDGLKVMPAVNGPDLAPPAEPGASVHPSAGSEIATRDSRAGQNSTIRTAYELHVQSADDTSSLDSADMLCGQYDLKHVCATTNSMFEVVLGEGNSMTDVISRVWKPASLRPVNLACTCSSSMRCGSQCAASARSMC